MVVLFVVNKERDHFCDYWVLFIILVLFFVLCWNWDNLILQEKNSDKRFCAFHYFLLLRTPQGCQQVRKNSFCQTNSSPLNQGLYLFRLHKSFEWRGQSKNQFEQLHRNRTQQNFPRQVLEWVHFAIFLVLCHFMKWCVFRFFGDAKDICQKRWVCRIWFVVLQVHL